MMNDTLDLNGTTGNLTTNELIPYNVRPETYIVPVLFLFIFLIGIIGNGTLIVIFIKHKHMRNVPNTYIFSLAIADLLVVLTSLPFTSIIYTTESWPWGQLICKLSESAKDLSVSVSVFTLTALSADRFFAIANPLKKFHTGWNLGGTKTATRITVSIAVLIWVLSLIIAVPAAVGSHIRPIPDENNTQFFICYPFPKQWLNGNYSRVMILFKFLALYLIPLIVIGVFYLGMAVSLITSTKNMPGEMQGLEKQVKARKKVAVTVLIFVAVFAVCFTPLHIFMLFFYFYPDFEDLYNAFWHYLRITGFCLNYINYSANPIALYFLSGAFRKYFNQYLFCKKTRRSRKNTYPHQHTSISLLSVKRNQVSITRNDKQTSIMCSTPGTSPMQETTTALLGNNQDDFGNANKKKLR